MKTREERGEEDPSATIPLPFPLPRATALWEGGSTSPPSLLTCSDKLLLWQHLGFQGEYLPALSEAVSLSTVTVGRKFSLPHLERALFLRMPPGERRPVTCLTTAAKFDSSVFSEDREASFADPGSVRQCNGTI